jgi:hypothetical protein
VKIQSEEKERGTGRHAEKPQGLKPLHYTCEEHRSEEYAGEETVC